MTMPIGMNDLRGIPPDKHTHTINHHHEHKQIDKSDHKRETDIMNKLHGICNPMNRFELLNGSIVFTNHSSLQELHLTLCKRLQIHVYHNNHDSKYLRNNDKRQNANAPKPLPTYDL